VGFRTIRVLVCDVSGRVRGHSQARLGLDHAAAEGLPVIRALTEEATARAGVESSRVIGAGVALRGPIDSERQRVSRSGEVGGWAGLTAAEIEDAVGHRVRLENDANLAALGEHTFGAGRDVRSSLTVKFHSGIGLGIVVNDELVTGVHGGAGEIGHVPVDPRGPLCRCGKRGCLDTVAAVPAIISAAAPRYGPLSLPDLLRKLGEGDTGITRLVQDSAAVVGHALANASLLLAPEKIIVVGAMARAGDAVLHPIRHSVDHEALPGTETRPQVALGELGDRCTPLGAAALALREASWLGDQRGLGPTGVRLSPG
jgi:predicted NBD/HSP70 family sugar kinase